MIDREITDYATGIFLRHFRPGVMLGVENPKLDLVRDIDLLRAHWAFSAPVREFLQYLLSHRHEAQSLLQFQRRTDDVVARGRIDARASLLARRVTGHPSIMVLEEPVRSYNTGPNQVVAWVVHMAAIYAERLFAHQSPTSAYASLIETAVEEISKVKRLDALREPLKHVTSGCRPGPNAIRDATRSRRQIYRYAITAFKTLSEIEAGNKTALIRVLQSTLLGPLENWRRFELAVAIGVGEALKDELNLPLQLSFLDAHPGQPILQCGPYALYWQSGGGLYAAPTPEPSEIKLKETLAAYGMATAIDRPDLVVVNKELEQVAAIIEVKYVTGDSARTRFREAANQVIRYGRGYSENENLNSLIRRSLIVTSHDSPVLVNPKAIAPQAVDFEGIKSGMLSQWVREKLFSNQ